MKIGFDLDHTIINYQNAFLHVAKEMGLIPEGFLGSKNDIKHCITQYNSHESWMALQGQVYGKGIHHAEPMQGVREFFLFCKKQNIPVVIISHKTQYGHFDQDKIDLRDAARRWLIDQKFFDPSYIGLQANQLYFEPTREEKVGRIIDQQCTHFFDDLPEVFNEPMFPGHIDKILYSPYQEHESDVVPGGKVMHHWEQAVNMIELEKVWG